MPEAMNTGRSGRILVVDDSTANLQLLTQLLTEHGYTVHPASDGELALEFVRSILPDLILLDIRMPGMDGFEICRRLKAEERTRSIPIIFISILEDEHDKVKGFQAGAVDYITKPFQPEEVLARVRIHLSLRELTEQLEQKVAERTKELVGVTEQLQQELAERKRTEEALRASEEKYRRIVDTANEGIWVLGPEAMTTFVNAKMAEMIGYCPEELLGRPLTDFMFAEDVADQLRQIEIRRQGISTSYELKFRRKDGKTIWTLVSATPVFDDAHHFNGSFAMFADITELKRAEKERLAHLRFIEHMEEIYRTIQGATDLEQVMGDVMGVILGIFDCDRAWLACPCDPSASSWRVPIEHTKPEYPGASAMGKDLPMDEQLAKSFRTILMNDGPVRFDPESGHALPEKSSTLFGIQSIVAMAIYPKSSKPWAFGLHQCSHARVWTPEEVRSVQEIGRRLGDALTTMLMYRSLQESEQRYRLVFENSPVSIWEEDFSEIKSYFDDLRKEGITDLDAYFSRYPDAIRRCAELVKIIDVNQAALAMHSAEEKQNLKARLASTFTPESFDAFREELLCLWNGATELSMDAIVKTLADELRDVTLYFSVCPGFEETLSRIIVSITDITTRKQAEDALRISERQKELILNSTAEMVIYYDRDLRVVWTNRLAAVSLGKTPEDLIGLHCHEIWCNHGKPCPDCPVMAARDGKAPKQGEMEHPLGRTTSLRAFPVMDENHQVTAVVGFAQDITEQKQAEEEKKKLQEEFLQAQKMESIGRLAGGVAHDFNNLLGVIMGSAEMALLTIDKTHPAIGYLNDIHKAAGRSANLTRQLLAFARKQTIAPKVLDLNETVEGMLNLLRRLIGEDINLIWTPGTVLWPVKVDPSQMDQVLANLCVNARDAIAGVGKISMHTENAFCDEKFCADNADAVPGEYVLLTVSDNGCGMDRATLDRLFEPFFTTKRPGIGTGLGLATVYGIVKQNDGFIHVYSEMGRGTTFKIYLPRHADTLHPERQESHRDLVPRGHETILLVEDEITFLGTAKNMLESLGYRVLSASTPSEALRISEEHTGELHMLFTDVILPEMTGRELAQKSAGCFSGTRIAVRIRLYGRHYRAPRRAGKRYQFHPKTIFDQNPGLQGA